MDEMDVSQIVQNQTVMDGAVQLLQQAFDRAAPRGIGRTTPGSRDLTPRPGARPTERGAATTGGTADKRTRRRQLETVVEHNETDEVQDSGPCEAGDRAPMARDQLAEHGNDEAQDGGPCEAGDRAPTARDQLAEHGTGEEKEKVNKKRHERDNEPYETGDRAPTTRDRLAEHGYNNGTARNDGKERADGNREYGNRDQPDERGTDEEEHGIILRCLVHLAGVDLESPRLDRQVGQMPKHREIRTDN